MFIRKLLLGGLAGGLMFYFLGQVLNGLYFTEFMIKYAGLSNTAFRQETVIEFSWISKLLAGFLFTYIFIRSRVNSLGEGFTLGGIVGFFMKSSFYFYLYSTTTLFSLRGIAGEIISFTIVSAIAGFAIVMVAGMQESGVNVEAEAESELADISF